MRQAVRNRRQLVLQLTPRRSAQSSALRRQGLKSLTTASLALIRDHLSRWCGVEQLLQNGGCPQHHGGGGELCKSWSSLTSATRSRCLVAEPWLAIVFSVGLSSILVQAKRLGPIKASLLAVLQPWTPEAPDWTPLVPHQTQTRTAAALDVAFHTSLHGRLLITLWSDLPFR